MKYLVLAAFTLLTAGLSGADLQQQKQVINKKTEVKKMSKQIIVDVRSKEEWNFDGHAPCSVNIPLDEFESRIGELKAYDSIVLVCRSGARAGVAKNILLGSGFSHVENLGPWQNVKCNQ